MFVGIETVHAIHWRTLARYADECVEYYWDDTFQACEEWQYQQDEKELSVAEHAECKRQIAVHRNRATAWENIHTLAAAFAAGVENYDCW